VLLSAVVVGQYISAIPPESSGFFMEFHSGVLCVIIAHIAILGLLWL